MWSTAFFKDGQIRRVTNGLGPGKYYSILITQHQIKSRNITSNSLRHFMCYFIRLISRNTLGNIVWHYIMNIDRRLYMFIKETWTGRHTEAEMSNVKLRRLQTMHRLPLWSFVDPRDINNQELIPRQLS